MNRDNEDRENLTGMENDAEFESYLRQFQPRKPKPLPCEPQRGLRPWQVWTAAAVVILALGITVAVGHHRFGHRVAISRQAPTNNETTTSETSWVGQVSLGHLNVAAHEGPDKLDELLEKTSPTLLPDVQRGHGVLSALAAE